MLLPNDLNREQIKKKKVHGYKLLVLKTLCQEIERREDKPKEMFEVGMGEENKPFVIRPNWIGIKFITLMLKEIF